MLIKILKIGLFISLCSVLGYFIGFFFSFIIIPDPCLYHTKEVSPFFELFFEITSANGYHPEPTIFYISIFCLLGFTASIAILIKKIKK